MSYLPERNSERAKKRMTLAACNAMSPTAIRTVGISNEITFTRAYLTF